MNSFKTLAKRIPGVYPLYRRLKAVYNVSKSLSSPFLRAVPAGHFYSPLPDIKSILKNEETLFNRDEVPLTIFRKLDANDILFIDSSHVVKINSDVPHLLFNVLPILNNGVVIHFHDIFWPFEYPKEWILGGIAGNEAYFVRAFMQFNNAFRILVFNAFMTHFHSQAVQKMMPLGPGESGGSFWIQKIAEPTFKT